MSFISFNYINAIPSCMVAFNPETGATNEYLLREVSRPELLNLRLNKQPGLVYKFDGKMYYTSIPKNFNHSLKDPALAPHLCGKNCSRVCKGCPRTRDLTVSFQMRYDKTFHEAVIKSWRLEKYHFIPVGIETFNLEGSSEEMIVLACDNYVKSSREPQPKSVGKKLVLGLANYIWEDFDGSYEDLRKRINCSKTY